MIGVRLIRPYNGLMENQSPVLKFLLLNERNLFWLFAASALIFIANWFLATHGYFEFENERLRQLLMAVSMFSPIIGILVLLSDDCQNGTPILAGLVFASLLLLWPTATITCFIVMLFCWTKTTRIIGVIMLVFVQALSGILFVTTNKQTETLELFKLPMAHHELVLRGVTDDGNYCSSLALQEDYPVAKGIRLVKTFYRLKDDDYAYKHDIFSLSPVDDNHAALVVQHGPRSQRVVVDLTIKNRWSEVDENTY